MKDTYNPSNKNNTHNRNRIFVHGLHPLTTQEDLVSTFSKFGTISDLVFKKDSKTGKHKGYAFFTVSSDKIAQKLITTDHLLHGRRIHCDLRNRNEADQLKNQKKRLFIGGIPHGVTNEKLTQVFQKFGKVRAAYSIKDFKGKWKSYGYVDFYKEESAQKALAAKSVYVYKKKIDVKPYEKKPRKSKGNQKQGQKREFKPSLVLEGDRLNSVKANIEVMKWMLMVQQMSAMSMNYSVGGNKPQQPAQNYPQQKIQEQEEDSPLIEKPLEQKRRRKSSTNLTDFFKKDEDYGSIVSNLKLQKELNKENIQDSGNADLLNQESNLSTKDGEINQIPKKLYQLFGEVKLKFPLRQQKNNANIPNFPSMTSALTRQC